VGSGYPPHRVRELLVRAAREVHGVVRASLAGGGWVPLGRGAGGDVTLAVDRDAEEAVLRVCRDSGMGFTILFEEAGLVDVNGGGMYLVVDALDGSRNAVRRIGSYCTSLAASPTPRFEDVSVGVVLEHTSGRMFHAVRGGGAFEGEEALRIVKHSSLGEAIIGVDFCGVGEDDVARLAPLVARAKGVRHLGANAFEISLVAAGGLDAHVDIRGRIRAVDIAAACIIVQEAGGVVTDHRGHPITGGLDVHSRFTVIAASGPALHAEIMGALGSRGWR
jgi:myo-inositol-1(or 4)-monophosphatase